MDTMDDWTYRKYRGPRPSLADALRLWARADLYVAISSDLTDARRGSILDDNGLAAAHFSTGFRLQQIAASALSGALTGRHADTFDSHHGPVWWTYGSAGPSVGEMREEAELVAMAAESVPSLVDLYRTWRDGLPALADLRGELGALDVDAALAMMEPAAGELVVHAPSAPVMDDTDTLPAPRWGGDDDDDPDADGAGVSFNPLDYLDEGSTTS